eukprot:CAMPEP_0171271554 /NCGR_PEP_ID=MMETSP0790-20130122/61291_1 /TAXON_ID=2925 /ORGANISM="Alexandrium catenella, Strain OF101" /LENGTH=248 /DNA_ID=CAMNT_0011740439 /DNA_START=78 /DNA_END=824 /DNA_ORIENTATION=-
MELNVKGSGSTKSFQLKGVEASVTVAELKKKCKEECGLEPDQQRLFLKGKLLKDEDTLEVAKIADKATLFLVKGASGSGGSGEKKEEAKEEKKDETPVATVLCLGGCGFYGTAKTENYCSKCYGKKQQTEEADADKARKERQEAEKAKEAEGEAVKEGDEKEGGAEGSSAAAEPEREEQKDKTKCWFCGKKCGLLGFECRCGYLFCSKCRYAEDHNCDFDHKGKGREILAKNNPNISSKGGEGLLDGI